MNEETKQEQAAQEVAAAAQAQSQGQEPQVKGESGQNQPRADPIRELEERIQEMESALNAMRERAALEAARAELVAAFGDKTAAEAALKLARADGLLKVEGEQVQVDLENLFARYPFLRARSAPRDAGANPPGTPALTREAIASMTPEEYARRRKEILDALAKGSSARR